MYAGISKKERKHGKKKKKQFKETPWVHALLKKE